MLSKSLKCCFAIASVAVCIFATGCCGPMGCGPGCGAVGDSCYDCDGAYYGARPIPNGPLDALAQMKRSLVCGGGCGEVYYGEWTSTPPDAVDPCCGSQFVGGATKCTPFCWQPGTILGGLYGQRFCDGSELIDGSCCGGIGCDTCLGGEIIDSGAGCGCATCDASTIAGGQTRIAHTQQMHTQQMPAQQQRVMTTQQTQRQMMASQQMQRTNQRMQGSQSRNARTMTSGNRTMYR